MVNEPIILDIRPTYIPLHVIQNMKNLSPQEQLALLYQHNVATGKADQSWSGFSSIVIPSTTANQPPLIKNISLSVNGHKAHFGTGGSGFGIHFGLNQKSPQQAANEQRGGIIRAENIDWEFYRLYPKDFDANFFIERVASEEGYSNGVPVDALFERHDLYEHDTYLDLLKILPNYDQKILTLHHTVNNKKKHFDRWLELKRYHIWQEDSPANREKTSLVMIKKIKFSQLINHLAGEIEKRHEQTRQLAQAPLNEELEKQFQAKLAQKIATEQARFAQAMRAEKQALIRVIQGQQKNIHSKKTEPVDSIFENHYREQDFERFIKQQPLTLADEMFDEIVDGVITQADVSR